MYIEQRKIRYRQTYFKIQHAEDVYYKNVMQEHPMIDTEPEHIRCEVEECKSQERYATKI